MTSCDATRNSWGFSHGVKPHKKSQIQWVCWLSDRCLMIIVAHIPFFHKPKSGSRHMVLAHLYRFVSKLPAFLATHSITYLHYPISPTPCTAEVMLSWPNLRWSPSTTSRRTSEPWEIEWIWWQKFQLGLEFNIVQSCSIHLNLFAKKWYLTDSNDIEQFKLSSIHAC